MVMSKGAYERMFHRKKGDPWGYKCPSSHKTSSSLFSLPCLTRWLRPVIQSSWIKSVNFISYRALKSVYFDSLLFLPGWRKKKPSNLGSLPLLTLSHPTQVAVIVVFLKSRCDRTSLAVQWLRRHACNTGDMGSILGQRAKIPQAAWPNIKKKKKKKKQMCPCPSFAPTLSMALSLLWVMTC